MMFLDFHHSHRSTLQQTHLLRKLRRKQRRLGLLNRFEGGLYDRQTIFLDLLALPLKADNLYIFEDDVRR